MRRLILTCVAAVLLAAGVAHGAPGPAESLPAEVMAFVEAPSVLALDGRLALLVRAVAPQQTYESLAAKLPQELLLTTAPSSVDLSKPLQLVVLAPPMHRRPVVVFYLADPQRYLDSLRADLTKLGEEGGVATYGEAPPEGSEEAPHVEAAIAVVGARAALGDEAEGVRAVRAMLAGGTLPPGVFADVHVGAAARPGALLAALSEEGVDPFQQVRLVAMPLAMSPQGEGMLRMLDAALEGVEGVARQVETVSGTVTFEGDVIAGWVRATLTPEGSLAAYLASVPGGELELLRRIPAGSSMVLATKVGDVGPLARWYAGLVRELVPPPEQEGAEDPLAGLAALAESLAGLMGGEAATGLSVQEGALQATSAVAVTDADRARELMGELAEMLPAMQDFQKELGGVAQVYSYEPDTVIYRGHSISRWSTSYDFEAAAQMPGGPQVARLQEAMIDEMWGGSADAYQTFLDGTMIHVQGAGALEALKAAVDGQVEPVVGSERLAGAREAMPADPIAIGLLSLEELLQFQMQAMVRAMAQAGQFMPPFLAHMRFEVGPPITFGTWITGDGAIEKRLRVPVESISNITEGFRRAFAPMMPPARQWEAGETDEWEDAEEQLPQSGGPAE